MIAGLGPHAYEAEDPGTGMGAGYLAVAVLGGLVFVIASTVHVIGLIRSILKRVQPGRRAQAAAALQALLLAAAIMVELWPLTIIAAPLLLIMIAARVAGRGSRTVAA
ncbi:hypothetical protein [Streptomyces sp. NPDC012888]|uniref:hypothetical protein n=1 Tax=Streptomyces sp. NPDC012888 TaxID=3364855 RepID=UPI0036CF51D8